MLRPLAILFLLLLTASAGAQPAFADPDVDVREVFRLIGERLQLMRDVAAWKHLHREPIVDSAREQQVLEQTVQQAAALGLEPQSARELLALQIRLAVRVQLSLTKSWQSGAAAPAQAHRRERGPARVGRRGRPVVPRWMFAGWAPGLESARQ